MNHDEITNLGHAIAKSLKNGGNGKMKPLTKWLLGSMFTLVIIFGSSAIGMVLNRIENNETALADRAPLVIGGAIEIENFKEWQKEMDEEVEEIKETVDTNSKKLDGLQGDMHLLLNQVLPDRRNPRNR